MKHLHRLERLERAAVAATRTVDEAYERRVEAHSAYFEAAWSIMSHSMSEEHARLVVEAYAAGMQDVRHPDWDSPAGTLLRRCLEALNRRPYWPYTQIKPDVAFAMPPQVAAVYLSDPRALPLHECEECGYKVPHQYFKECPLCGGRVGWYAYWKKHKDYPRPDSCPA